VTVLRERLAGLSPYRRFSLLLAGALVFGSIVLALSIAAIVERFVADDTARETAREIEVHYPNIFGYGVFSQPLAPADQAIFNRNVRFHLDVYDVVRARMYGLDGTVVYSYDQAEVGRSAFDGPDAERARRAAAGEISFLVNDAPLAKPPPPAAAPTPAAAAKPSDAHDHPATAGTVPAAAAATGPVMRVWAPIHRQGEGIVGVAQVDRNITPLVGAIRQMQLFAAGVVVLGSVFLFLVLRRIYADASALLRAREAAERSARVQVAALEELARLKDEFVSQVSHELRGPLSPIFGYAELLIEQRESPEAVQRYAGVIQEGAGRLQRLVDDLLDLNRLESGRYRLERQPVPVGDLLERRARELRHLSTRHTIVLNAPATLPAVDVDPDRVSQVVTNLVTNAVRYSPDGGEIRLRAARQGDTVIVSVSDQGIGIPADRVGRIFEKFYRVDNSVTRSVSGTGLGLAISRELVEAHGGRMSVESTPGAGSTFSFSLPVASPIPSAAPQPLAAARQ
jgi:signal transduction histidine kinase